MGRSVEEIKQSIDDQKASEPSLSSLNSLSNVSIWGGIRNVASRVLWYFENMIHDPFKQEIQDTIDQARIPTAEWYAERSKEFQYGDDFTVVGGKARYATIDESKQIVAEAVCVRNIDGTATIKLAKLSGGDLVALDPAEKTAFDAYLDKFMIPGSKIEAQTANADLAKLFAVIYFNALYPLPALKTAVEAAVSEFIKDIPFNGVLVVNDLIAKVRAVPGVNDMVISILQYKKAGGDYISANRQIVTSAGYIRVDPDFPLSATLSYSIG